MRGVKIAKKIMYNIMAKEYSTDWINGILLGLAIKGGPANLPELLNKII